MAAAKKDRRSLKSVKNAEGLPMTHDIADLAALQKDMLPDGARSQLGMLVTELGGIGRVLREIPGDEDHGLHAAVSMWVDRIATDLGEMECRRYPATEPAR